MLDNYKDFVYKGFGWRYFRKKSLVNKFM
jgi:hypothetical protein